MKTKIWCGSILAVLALLGAGCDTVGARHQQTSSLFSYLYADQTGHTDEPSVPVLSLPLRVGVAFVPMKSKDRGSSWSRETLIFSEQQKLELARRVAGEFVHHEFIKSVDLIPSAYLAEGGSFRNLDQLRQIYGIDVVVLLSYDQVQFTDQGALTLSYWTIVGAYVVQGEKNDTQTMIDAAVYDIASRKLLFRSPGLSEIKGSATPVNLSEQLRRDSAAGFEVAATNLVANLTVQLEEFKGRVKNAPTEYRIEFKPGYTGAGNFGGAEIVFIGMLAGGVLLGRWHRKS